MSLRRAFVMTVGIAVLAGVGCAPSHTFFRPEGATLMPNGGDLGRRYEVPPGSGAKGARVMVSTDGARVVLSRSREKVTVVRIRLAVENLLEQPIKLAPREMSLVDPNGTIFPARYVTTSGLGEDGSVGAGQKTSVDVYFELGPPAMIVRVSGFTVRWGYEIDSKGYSVETPFTRFEPLRFRRYHDSWYDPWPAGWVWWMGIGGIGHHHSSSSLLRWGP